MTVEVQVWNAANDTHHDWTRESGTRTVTVKAAMDARADDILIVEYLYYAGTPVVPGLLGTVPSGPKFWYKFDETSGTTATDSSGNDYHATYSGTYTLGAARVGNAGAGTSLSASNGGFRGVNTVAATSAGAWINTSTSGSVMYGAALGAVARHWVRLSTTYVGFGQQLIDYVETSYPSASLKDGNDHLVVTVTTGTQLLLYVDGTLVDNVPFTGRSIWFATEGYQTTQYAGRIDDFIGWERQLTADEIQAWYGN